MKLSIIIPVYNAHDYLIKCLDSIPARDDIEVLCIDDCSTDDSLKILNSYKRIPLRVFHNEKNMGIGYTTNVGYDNAIGEYVTGLDNDDYLLTDKYDKLIDKLYNYSDFEMIFFANEINNGTIWDSPERTAIWCYFIRRDFLGSSRMIVDRWASDGPLTRELKERAKKVITIHNCVYHYNYPRVGSVVWNKKHEVEK